MHEFQHPKLFLSLITPLSVRPICIIQRQHEVVEYKQQALIAPARGQKVLQRQHDDDSVSYFTFD